VSNPAAAPVIKKPKLFELDIVRALAILAVVMIHATSSATIEPTEGSFSQIFFYSINLASTFAVPLFILVSGIVLFYSYDGRWSAKAAMTFYWKRAVSLVIPYLIWASFYYAYNQYLNTHKFVMDWSVFLRMLRWAEWSYHSYFMLIIFQMYVLFPVFMTMVARISWFRKCLVPIGIAVQGGFYIYRHWFGAIGHSDRIAPTYMAYFLIGGAIGLYYTSVKAWVERHALLVAVAALLGGCSYVGLFLLNRYKHIQPENTWFEIAWFFYVIAIALFFMQVGRIVLRRFRRTSVWLTSIGACSFGIYLFHPAVLSAYSVKLKAPTSILMYDLYTLNCFLTVFGISWLAVYLYGRAAAIIRKPAAKGKSQSSGKSGASVSQ
jgi:probable poly-beta-1,6-N-acetyl-D-glucosamine export protein